MPKKIIWKRLEYYHDLKEIYMISSDGQIKNSNTQRILRPYIDSDGYCQITLGLKSGKQKRFPLHRLVAYNFVPEGYSQELTVNHKDDNKQNNYYSNLEWMSGGDNVKAAYKTGANKPDANRLPVTKSGEENFNATLTNIEVKRICRLIMNGFTNKQVLSIVETYGISDKITMPFIEAIKNKKNWKDISDKYFKLVRNEDTRKLKVIPTI